MTRKTRRHLLLCGALIATLLLGAWQPAEQPTATDAPWVEVKKGLMMRDIVEGEGEPLRRGQRVSVRYAGWLEDGTLFDTNRGKALMGFELGDGSMIRGWELGMVGMKRGGTRQLRVPGKMGYGKRGIKGRIPKDATLLFEIELLSISPRPR